MCGTSIIHLSIHSNIYCISGRVRLRLRGRATTVLHSTCVCSERATPTHKEVPLCLDVAPDSQPGRDEVPLALGRNSPASRCREAKCGWISTSPCLCRSGTVCRPRAPSASPSVVLLVQGPSLALERCSAHLCINPPRQCLVRTEHTGLLKLTGFFLGTLHPTFP